MKYECVHMSRNCINHSHAVTVTETLEPDH